MKMTEDEERSARKIIEQKGNCTWIICFDCPAFRISKEKHLKACFKLWEDILSAHSHQENPAKCLWFKKLFEWEQEDI